MPASPPPARPLALPCADAGEALARARAETLESRGSAAAAATLAASKSTELEEARTRLGEVRARAHTDGARERSRPDLL